MSKTIFQTSLTILFIISLPLFANTVASLNLTVKTDKQVYNVGETVKVSGNLTLNNSPVSNGLVAVQVNDPKSHLYTIRTFFTGQPFTSNWTVEVLEVYLSDQVGNPKSSVKRGTLAYFTVKWRNNDQIPHLTSITLSLYYGNIQPFLAFVPFTGTLRAQESGNMTVSAPIPAEAPTGTATVYAAIFSTLPSHGGFAYCPEKSSTFTITATSSLSLQTEPIQPQSVEGTYNLTFSMPRREVKLGNYTIYVASLYEGQLASAISNFQVILLGDLNRDGVVDMKDVTAILRRFGAIPTDPKWDPEHDLNKDNIIDMKDVTIVLRNYGNSGTY